MTAPGTACGANTLATITTVDSASATDIYTDELDGGSVTEDLNHVTSSKALATAVAANSVAATKAAVVALVFHPAWHIVRLRVFNDTGKLLSDVGGPYVIAPVKGVISLNGVAVGRFVMSVQDDVGYTKLETRTIGDPIGIYVKGKLAVETSQGKRVVVELGGNFPSNEPSGKSLVLAGVRYHVLTRTYRSFPDSHLQAVIAIPLPTAEMKAQSCDAVRVSELERLTNTLSIQFPPLTQHFHEFVGISGIFIGVHLIVREGATVLATNIGPGPTSLPSRGRVTYRGVNWFVVSSSPSPGVRIYLLAPTNSNAIAGASGATGAVGSTRSTGTAGAAGPQV